MNNKGLLDAFNVKRKNSFGEVKDYETFSDKDLAEQFRLSILEGLSDKGFKDNNISHDLINSEIDDVTLGYDLSIPERNYLFNLIDGEVNGYGPLTELLSDENISEIMVNSPHDIYIEIDGTLKKDDSVSFINDEHIMRTINKLISDSGKTIDVNTPMVDAVLKDGNRINAIIPPLSKKPIITIRKFKKNMDSMDTLIGNGSLTPYMARFLEACVKARLNIIISGSSGAGKTSLLNILGEYISNDERIITIEDVLELSLNQSNVVSLETRLPNYDGNGEVTVRDLVRNAMRMRPDRIIIGEIRGGEAFDLLQAMNTGHEGSLATLHASSCRDALNKLETMVLMDGLRIPVNAIRGYIANALDLVVQINRMRDGRRKITSISEVVGIVDDKLVLNDIFEYITDGKMENGLIQGEFVLNPGKPKILDKIKNEGITDILDMFKNKK